MPAFTAPPAAVAPALGWYNFIRFGNPFEFGHSYLPEFVRDGGQFTLENFWQNLWNVLRPVTLTSSLELSFSTFNGFCLFVASPIFLLWAVDIVRAAAKKRLAAKDLLAPALALITLAALCLHRTMGGWQFGARYTVNLIPLALWWYLTRPRRPLGTGSAVAGRGGRALQFLRRGLHAEPLKGGRLWVRSSVIRAARLMVLFVAAAGAAVRKAPWGWLSGRRPARPPRPRWAPGPGALALAAFGVLAAQFLFAFLCWLDLGQTGGLAAFWQHFFERFTTAGDSPHYLLLAREGYAAEGDAAKYIVFLSPLPLGGAADARPAPPPFRSVGRRRPWR